jgi:syntaxin-binding protein 1
MIVFVAGGITYSEMRLAYTVGQALGKEIFIGEPPRELARLACGY